MGSYKLRLAYFSEKNMISLMKLKGIVSDYSTLISFVTGGDLSEILGTFGDIHLDAAKNALNKRDLSLDKRQPIESAINHLEGARASFVKIIKGGSFGQGVTYAMAVDKVILTLCLMATCYLYLQEVHLAKQCVEEAKQIADAFTALQYKDTTTARSHYDESLSEWSVTVISTMLNPIEWAKAFEWSKFSRDEKQKTEFESFYEEVISM